jgi:protein TonB
LRGPIAALAISLAAHAAFLIVPWSSSATQAAAGMPTVLSTRLLPAQAVEPAPEPARSDAEPPAADPSRLAGSSEPATTSTSPTPPELPLATESSRVAVPTPAEHEPIVAPPDPGTHVTDASPLTVSPAASSAVGEDRGPQPLDDLQLDVPAEAGARGGSVTLRLVISDKGVVESAEVVRSSPPGLFDAAALAAARRVRFSPGLKGGLPVRTEVVREVTFAAAGRGTDTSSRKY